MDSQNYMTVISKALRNYQLYALLMLVLVGCASNSGRENRPTLADFDKPTNTKASGSTQTKIDNTSRDDVRKAYKKYIATAPAHDRSRQTALTRLAELELELSNSLSKDSADDDTDAVVSASLENTIQLLETTLRDYPNAKNNDKVLYQLAQAYDRAGRYDDSIASLETLSRNYLASPYYSEAQFRVAEGAFAKGDYIRAEDAYTEVILAPDSDKFYEKSVFKRGWTRYKQQLYEEALDDYINAITLRRFGKPATHVDSEKSQFEEYMRAVGLAFSYLNGDGVIRDYFANVPNFRFIYETYATVSDIYIRQERYSDAAKILEQYTRFHPVSENTPLAELKIIDAWKTGQFASRLNASIEGFYLRYRNNAPYWSKLASHQRKNTIDQSIRAFAVEMSAYFHQQYDRKKSQKNLNQAKLWYERYLKDYRSYANKDNIYSLYGELLVSSQQPEKALEYFTYAAYDGAIILDKKAAYSTISLSRKLIDTTVARETQASLLTQHLGYAKRFIELYTEDQRSTTIALSAAELAFKAKDYENTVALTNYVPDSAPAKLRFNANNLKAQAFLALEQYTDAEATYIELLSSKSTDTKANRAIRSSLALSIYRQGESAKQDNAIDRALNHYTRIGKLVPESNLAAIGLYDAIALTINMKRWNQSIALSQRFKNWYPKHKYSSDVTKKLSVAYLNSDQKGKAAQEFERIAQFEDQIEIKMAAQWQAAELYESKNNIDGAIRAYREYAHTYPTPYQQNMEAMFKLTKLYQKAGTIQKRFFWQTRIRRADQKATKGTKTERTEYIASTTTLDLAKQKKREFNRQKLVEPIAKNLKLKKAAMQEAVKLFGQASAYGISAITTEATSNIGNIYNEFSQDLLTSERPKNLNEEELEQYEILLEDQAFPFEEKAIEFYEANLTRTKDGTYDKWVEQSYTQLVSLFPVRYQRKGKIGVYYDAK